MSTIVFLFMHRINDRRLLSAEITGGKEILLLSVRWTMQGYNLIDEKYALSTVFYAYLIREQFLIKRYSRKGTLLTYSRFQEVVELFANERKKQNDNSFD